MTTLLLHDVVPETLRERAPLDSEIWGRDVEFESGSTYQLLAPSGRGKSTLMHILYGLRSDFDGDVTVHGSSVDDIDREGWARLRQSHLAIVFQNLGLFPHLSGIDNIRVKSELNSGCDASEIEAMCVRVGIEDLLDRFCATMSYGERQRVAIVRALAQPFDWLLLDEPFSHLDAANSDMAADLIRERCAERGAGCLITSLDEGFHFDFRRTYRI